MPPFWNGRPARWPLASDLFRELGALGDDFDPATLPAMAEAYGCQVDFEGTASVIERHGLRF
jgi:hypothetical protein